MHFPPIAHTLSFFLASLAVALPALAQQGSTANTPPPTHVVMGNAIPPGAKIQALLDTTLSTEASHPGDQFTASVVSPFYDAHGDAIIPAGAQLMGRVLAIEPGRDGSASARITVAIGALDVRGSIMPIAASVVRMQPTMSQTSDRETPQPQVIAGSRIEVELTQPVSVAALRHATSERAFGGGPRP